MDVLRAEAVVKAVAWGGALVGGMMGACRRSARLATGSATAQRPPAVQLMRFLDLVCAAAGGGGSKWCVCVLLSFTVACACGSG